MSYVLSGCLADDLPEGECGQTVMTVAGCPETVAVQWIGVLAFQLNSLFAMRLIKKYYFCNNTEYLFR